jgi:hypothetical protein
MNHQNTHCLTEDCMVNIKNTIDKQETGLYNNGQFSAYRIQEIKNFWIQSYL